MIYNDLKNLALQIDAFLLTMGSDLCGHMLEQGNAELAQRVSVRKVLRLRLEQGSSR